MYPWSVPSVVVHHSGEAGTSQAAAGCDRGWPAAGHVRRSHYPGVVVVELANQPQELGPVELVCSLLCRDGGNHLVIDVGTGQGMGAPSCRWRAALDPARENDLAGRLVHRCDMPARRLPGDRLGSVAVISPPRAVLAR